MSRILALCLLITSAAWAVDWPEWRGEGRGGVWTEDGILETFPEEGLAVSWRRPIARGYSGAAVADGRVFITQFEPKTGNRGVESALALDEQTGRELWRASWQVDYAGLEYDLGPRATPTVDGDRVYVLGAMGDLLCLDVASGEPLWSVDYIDDFDAQLPTWGFVGAPLVDGSRLIALVGGRPDAKVVAFNKRTGKEAWRALSGEGETGYVPPIAIEAGGRRQIVVWHPQAVSSLDPRTGRLLWEQPFPINVGLAVATPVLSEHGLLVSAFYNGSRLYRLDSEAPDAELVWKGNSDSEIDTDGSALAGHHARRAGRLHLRHRQLRPPALSRRPHRRARLGVAGGHRRERALGLGADRAPRRPLHHQQRPRRADHRQALARGL